MNKVWKWLLGIGIVVLVILMVALPIASRFGVLPESTRYATGMNTFGHHGMYGVMPYGIPFGGGLMMFGMFVFPVLLAGLAVFGLVALIRRQPEIRQGKSVVTSVCSSCGETLQDAWIACPYCGESVCEAS